jgi:hypothetical protein
MARRRHRRAEPQSREDTVEGSVNPRRPAELLGSAALLVAALWAGGLGMALALCIAIALALDTQP